MGPQHHARKRARPDALQAHVVSHSIPLVGGIAYLATDKEKMLFFCTGSGIYVISPVISRLAASKTLFTMSNGNIDVSRLAGSRTEVGFADGEGSQARFDNPRALIVDHDGSLLVVDTGNNRLRRVTMKGVVSTVAGSGEPGFLDGKCRTARFDHPWGIEVDRTGKKIYVSDRNNSCIRVVNTSNGMVTTLCGNGKMGSSDGQGVAASFKAPKGIAMDNKGNLLVCDSANHTIRKVMLTSGEVSTIAGSCMAGCRGGFADGTGTTARFLFPCDIVVDGDNNMIVTDAGNNCIRMIKGKEALVTTIAGTTEKGMMDGGGIKARFKTPLSLALSMHGSLFVADLNVGFIRLVKTSLTPPRHFDEDCFEVDPDDSCWKMEIDRLIS